jgi:hypothetical protein
VKSFCVAIAFLAFILGMSAQEEIYSQTAATSNKVTSDKLTEELMSELEDIAMCHHAIQSAHHQATFSDQNAYYRYLLVESFGAYPKAERCEAVTEKWVVNYATEPEEDKKSSDIMLKGKFGVTFPEIASDAKFISTVTLYKAMGESRWRTLGSPDAIK